MSDQADGLRQMVRARSGTSALAERPRPRVSTGTRSLVLTSGKGGVGTSNLALNLAIVLGERGQRVVLVDADLGLANIDLLCGLTPPSDLGEILEGDRPMSDAIVPGPGGIRILPGAHGSRTLIETLADAPARLVDELAGLEADADLLIVDAGSGLGSAIGALAIAADAVAVVTTPEPTSLADAHAAIHRFRRLAEAPDLLAIVNQAESSSEGEETLARLAASSRQFLGAVVEPLGFVRADPRVPLAVRARRPFSTVYPGAVASRDVRRLARVLLERERQRGRDLGPPPRSRRPGFFAALAARWALRGVSR